MTFNDYLQLPASKKIVLAEIDSPLNVTWLNFQPGIWFAWLTPGKVTDPDDHGNIAFWGNQNETTYNIGSVNVAGTIYTKTTSLANCIATDKSWFYDSSTTYIYVHFEDGNPPESFTTKAPGAIIGFSSQVDLTNNNYYEDIFYEPTIKSIPNLTKKKDALFFGILQFQGGSISFENLDGFFDNFSQLDLYGQPVRIRMTFGGLAYSESLLVYSGKVEDFAQDFTTFKVNIADVRKYLSRKLPVNSFSNSDSSKPFFFPTMDDKLDGTPVPIIFGPVIKAPAYKTSSGNWTFADTLINAIDSGIVVFNADGGIFIHGGTETDGTFTGANTDEALTVSCIQSTVINGLDVISFILETYEDITFNASNYDLTEWNAEQPSVKNEGIWIGIGSLKSSVDVIEQVCTNNQGIFDVLADGRFTFRLNDPDRTPVIEIMPYDEIGEPIKIDDSEEFLSSVKIEFSKDLKENIPQIFTNLKNEAEVFGRYRQRKERSFPTTLTSRADAEDLSDRIMELSKFIFPQINTATKTQFIELRILDNVLYTYQRQSGKVIIGRSRYQALGIRLDLNNFEIDITMKQIRLDDGNYTTPDDAFNEIFDGGGPATDYDWYDGGTPAFSPPDIIDGGTP